jgi:hypothetical protein
MLSPSLHYYLGVVAAAVRATLKRVIINPLVPRMNRAAICAAQWRTVVGVAHLMVEACNHFMVVAAQFNQRECCVTNLASGAGEGRFEFTFPAARGAEIFVCFDVRGFRRFVGFFHVRILH